MTRRWSIIGGDRYGRLGVGINPPKVLHWPKPESSMRTTRTFGAPSGALIRGILSGLESLYVSPMTPLKGGSGRGSTSWAIAGQAHAAAARPPKKRRVTIKASSRITSSLSVLSKLSEARIGTRQQMRAPRRGVTLYRFTSPNPTADPEGAGGGPVPSTKLGVRISRLGISLLDAVIPDQLK